MNRGFSLVELSIVLVILGLLTGGILAGQNLIRAAELRSVTTERDRYAAAWHIFQDKYFAIPGDMRNAENFWGTASGGCPAGAGTGTQTCNGDGNGRIESSQESVRAWQQMANAGLIEGSFTGVLTTPAAAGTNVPRARLNNSAWWLGGPFAYYSLSEHTYYEIGRITTNQWPHNGTMSAEEAWNIDTKMDDGSADSGSVIGLEAWAATAISGNCVTAVFNAASAEYILDGAGTDVCRVFFRRQ